MANLIILSYLYINTFSSFILLLTYNIIKSSLIPKALILKDVYIFFLFYFLLLIFLVRGKIYMTLKFCTLFAIFIFLISLFVFFFLSPAEMTSKLIYLRRYSYFLLIFVLFNAIPIKQISILNLIRHLKLITFLVIIWGFFEYATNLKIWYLLNLNDFWASISIDPWANVPLEESGRFFSWDLSFIIGHKIQRAVSIFLDPTLLSSFIIAVLPIFLYGKGLSNKIFSFLLIILGILTVSKAFFLALFIFIFYSVFQINTQISIIFIILTIFVAYFLVNIGLNTGPFSHVAGMYTSIEEIVKGKILGIGFGVAGNYGELDVGAESGFGSMLGNIGVFAFLYLIIIFSILRQLEKIYRKTNYYLYKSVYVSLFAWTAVMLYSESAFGITGNAIIFLLAGLLLNKNILINFYKEDVK